MLINLSINSQEIVDKITRFIKEAVSNAGFSRVVVGLSGGIDSAVSTTLAVKALGADNVYIGLFPYGELNKEGLEDAKLIVQKLGIPNDNIILVDIKPLADPIIAVNSSADDLRRGNIMVRMRMILLYDLSKKFNALVLGTENKTEHLLGYFTRFGDEASDIESIKHLYKTQVKQLAQYLGVPDKIIQQAPTAGMWQGQTDEEELGFTYEEADKILYLYTDLKKKKEEIGKMGFSSRTVDKVISRVEKNKFKHELPYIIC